MPVAVIVVAVQPARREETPPASWPRVFYEAGLNCTQAFWLALSVRARPGWGVDCQVLAHSWCD